MKTLTLKQLHRRDKIRALMRELPYIIVTLACIAGWGVLLALGI